MPAPQHIQITFTGVLGTLAIPVEIFSFGLSADPGNTDPISGPFISPVDMKTLADSIAPKTATLMANLSSRTILTRVRCALIGADGLTAKDPAGTYVQGDAALSTAGSSTPMYPPQVALAVTTQSLADGPTGRGRFYLPMPGMSVGDDLRLTALQADGFATNVAKPFLDGINASLAERPYGRLVVASAGSALKGIPPALRPINEVLVGRALDTIRTRRNNLVEEYAAAALAP